MRSRGLTQGVTPSALVGPEELAREHGLPSILRLGSNESPYGPSPRARAAIARAADGVHRYGDPSCHDLRAELARRHRVALENVLIGAGIDELLGLIVRAYLAPGAPAVASLGGFPTFEMHVNGFEGRLDRVPYLASGRVDLDGYLAATRRHDGALVFLPNPDNPTGSYVSWGDMLAFAQALPPASLLIHDEAYANFLPPQERFPDDAIVPGVVRLRTFSKEYGLAGLRVGYALAERTVIQALDAIRLLYGVNRIALEAALVSLSDWRYVEGVLARIAEGRAEYVALGAQLGLPALPSTTNFVLFDCGRAERAVALLQALLARGIHIRKPPFAPLDRCVRITVGAPDERKLLAEALRASLLQLA